MYAQSILPAIAPLSTCLQPAPIAPSIAQPPAVVPRSQSWCNLVTTDAQAPTTYTPPEVKRVGVSYRQEPIAELLKNGSNEWTLCLPISTPSDLINPTLTSLAYYIKYATTHDNRDSTVQTDIILTTESCPSGIILDPTDLVVYCDITGDGPRMIDEEAAVRLLSVTSRKCNGGSFQSSHHTDHHYITPNIRVVEASNLYLTFHVFEHPTAEMLRSLAVEITATWLDDVLERKRREDERREEEKKKAKEAMKAEEERKKEEKKKAEEAKERAEAVEAITQVEAATEEAVISGPVPLLVAADIPEAEPSNIALSRHADSNMQRIIEDTVKKFDLEPCPNGYGWSEEDDGYRCNGGRHFVSFEQLGVGVSQRTTPRSEVYSLREEESVAPKVYQALYAADEEYDA